MVKIDDLPKSQQPRSDDPDFWNVWTGKDAKGNVVERKANWKLIADDWQGNTNAVGDSGENEHQQPPGDGE